MPTFAQVRLKGGVPGNPTQIFSLRFSIPGFASGALPASDLLGMANNAQEALLARAALFSTDFFLGNASAQEYQRLPGPPPAFSPITGEVGSTSPQGFGTALFPSGSPQTAFVVTLRTGLAGGRHRGRVYTFTPPENIVGPTGSLSDGADRVALVREIAQEVEGSSVGVIIDNIVHSLTYGVETEVISYSASNRVDTQRRRLRRE